MSKFFKVLRFFLAAGFAAFTAGVLALVGAYLYLAPDLPEIKVLKHVEFQVPLRVYARDGSLMAEFGEKRRSPIKYANVPDLMVKAFLAAEDDRFFTHPGVDYHGLLRAAIHLARTGQKGQGGSTITMQVARNFFLSREKTYLRKLNEIFLALKIERELSKEEIFELYLNIIYLGNRAYGVKAAAQVYYGVNVHELTLPQIAMIAGLPKAPSRFNPIVNPTRAIQRRNYVLRRMHELGYISDQAFAAAQQEPVSARLHALSTQVEAPYVAEMVRAEMVKRYGSDTYIKGYRVYTTLDSSYQSAANKALRKALQAYDFRHGYRGPEKHFDGVVSKGSDEWDRILADIPLTGELVPGLVLEVQEKAVQVYRGKGEVVTLNWDALKWARPAKEDNKLGPAPKLAADILKPGDLIRLFKDEKNQWKLAQVPAVSGAIVALNPKDGALLALVGGFDYFHSKFNRVTQAHRQPGSSFKPFIYSAALEKGYTAASIINDAPVVFKDSALEGTWRPENYSGKFYGPTRMRVALTHSRNLVSIRLLRSIGIGYAVKHLSRFNISRSSVRRDLSLALGSGSITPLQLATAYTVFANGGFGVSSYFIDRIESEKGEVLFSAKPKIACAACEKHEKELAARKAVEKNKTDKPEEKPDANDPQKNTKDPVQDKLVPVEQRAPRVLDARNAYLIYSMMRDVIRQGTARRALKLGRTDIAGKTGTTNDQRDAWFSGFNGEVVASAWVGFDKVRPLGNRETGGRAALPMWIDFMSSALKGVPDKPLEQPEGLVTVRIDTETGLLAGGDARNAIFEIFRTEYIPKKRAESGPGVPGTGPASNNPGASGPNIIF